MQLQMNLAVQLVPPVINIIFYFLQLQASHRFGFWQALSDCKAQNEEGWANIWCRKKRRSTFNGYT